jgi:hypothetical protein
MSCLCRDEQIVEVNGRRVLLKGVRETFNFVRLIQSKNHNADLGPVLVRALRDVGNHIPPDEEDEYSRTFLEMFAVYYAVEPVVGCR